MSTETERQLADNKMRAFFEADIYRCKTEAEINTVLVKYSGSNFQTEYVLRILKYAGSSQLSLSEKGHFDQKVKSILAEKNLAETQKPTHIPRPARQR